MAQVKIGEILKNYNFNASSGVCDDYQIVEHDKLGNLLVLGEMSKIKTGNEISNLIKTPESEEITKLYFMLNKMDASLSDEFCEYAFGEVVNIEGINSVIDKYNERSNASEQSGGDANQRGGRVHIYQISEDQTIEESEPLFSAELITKGKTLFVETNETEGDFRRMGLQKMGFETITNLASKNGCSKIGLEVGELDGVSRGELVEIYRNLGFDLEGYSEEGSPMMSKDVEMESEMGD